MTTAKNAVFVRLYLGNCCLVGEEFTFGGGGGGGGGIKIWWGE